MPMDAKGTIFDGGLEADAVQLYDDLKDCVENRSKDIKRILPLFWRNALDEGHTGWTNWVNRHDFLVFYNPDSSLFNLQPISETLMASQAIKGQRIDALSLTKEEFLDSEIVRLNGESFSVKDLIRCLAYHAQLHNLPNDQKLIRLRKGFVEEHPRLAQELTFEIGSVLVDSFEDVRKKYDGNKNGNTSLGLEPLVVKAGNVIKFRQGGVAGSYSGGFIQAPISPKEGYGVRVCFDVQFQSGDWNGTILSVGHRQGWSMEARRNGKAVLFSCKTPNDKQEFPLLDRIQFLTGRRRFVELSIYPDGSFVVGLEQRLRFRGTLSNSPGSGYGKIVIGANQSGENCGQFLHSLLHVEWISPSNELETQVHYTYEGFYPKGPRKLSPLEENRPIF
jgi:hypothetical protein